MNKETEHRVANTKHKSIANSQIPRSNELVQTRTEILMNISRGAGNSLKHANSCFLSLMVVNLNLSWSSEFKILNNIPRKMLSIKKKKI
jgi:hypothetical protein